jgi:dTDP-4-dehydrorhamnose reductase
VPSLVLNAVAHTTVDRAETEVERAFRVNAGGTGIVAIACAAVDVPLVQLSTDHMFDGTKAGHYTEDDRVAPLNTYGRGCPTVRRLAAGAAPWGTYHFAGIGATTWHGFAAAIVDPQPGTDRRPAVPITTAEYPQVARRPATSALESEVVAAFSAEATAGAP